MSNDKFIWKMKDGRTVKIEDMSDTHLLNTLFWMGRNRHLFQLKGWVDDEN